MNEATEQAQGAPAHAARPGPLSGVRVLDLSRVLAGPMCAQILGDLGAEVVKIEDVESGDQTRGSPPFLDGLSHYFIAFNRNKQSVALDLKAPEGRALLLRIVGQCDVLLENFRPGVMDKLGLPLATLKAANPRLVTCAISGFGQTGAWREKPAFDIITQALSGAMSINGDPAGPPQRLGLPMGDIAGGLWAAIGVLAALRHRDATGEALAVDYSLLDGLVSLLGYLSQLYFLTGESPPSAGNGHHSISPYGSYAVKDGAIVVAAMTPTFFGNFCRAVGRAELLADDRFATVAARKANLPALEAIVREVMATRTRAEWLELLEAADVPCAPVASVGEALEQDVLRERGLLQTITTAAGTQLRVVGSPLHFAGAFEGARHAPPPEHGAHTAAWLARLGLDAAEMQALAERGIIRLWNPGPRSTAPS